MGKKGILIIDTTQEHCGTQLVSALNDSGRQDVYEYIDTTDLNISHCLGCNYCWLKTPGKCAVKDDYEPILMEMSAAEQVWLVSDTKFGFVSYKTKNIVDRVMPLVTMNLHIHGNQMRHVMRYDHNPDFGVVYTGDGDQNYLSEWCKRLAVNFGTKSLGVYRADQIKEAVSCMQ